MTVRPFVLDVPQGELDDLRERLRRTRLVESDLGWSAGTPARFLRELVDYWIEEFDWRGIERRVNDLPQFEADIATRSGEFRLHFVHARGRGPEPLPLVFSHGWPGSFWEVHRIIGPLTDPVAHGGDAADAFDVVAPSLPGYGFSPHPGRPGVDPSVIADAFHALMTDTLGYRRYVAQGGDWGSFVTAALGRRHHGPVDGVAAIHLNFFPGRPSPADAGGDDFLQVMEQWNAREGAYAHMQATRPLTIGHALSDSPAGLAAWIVEKFRSWSDCGGDVESVFSKDDLLTGIMFHWLGGTGATAARLYYEAASASGSAPPGPAAVPTAYAAFAGEFFVPSREIVSSDFDLRQYSEFPRGGHFAALEQPDALVGDIRSFFRRYR
ncbi:epoxide hydrolase family protein [Pseudonocardia sp. ICBG1293]|uniref:epoxide hydrolase family protein n=1 Tax=Pseudonocardia sp. ICBG1293 TaxID=2844382 RepID=UPI001CCF241B|nr:epoxide hydrolase family protein [Pseudonocardia sp. ICBG1293]